MESRFWLTRPNVDFSVSSSGDPTEVSVYTVSGGNPTLFPY
jgi:hypothetical protein